MGTLGAGAGLNVRGGVGGFECELDLVFDGAGDAVAFFDVPPGGNHDVKIDPMVASAVSMAELVVAANLRLLALGANMAVEDGAEHFLIAGILFVHEPGGGAFDEA